MKDNVGYIVEQLDSEYAVIYLANGVNFEDSINKSILIFSHDLSRSGAPTVLLNFTRILIDKDYFVMVVSPKDGPLRDDFLQSGANIIIYDEYIADIAWQNRAAGIFDIYFANTLICADIVRLLSNKVSHIYWWIHEGETLFIAFPDLCMYIPDSDSLEILVANQSIQPYIKKYLGKESKVFNFYVPDECDHKEAMYSESAKKLKFLQIGMYSENKGQKYLLNAIRNLSPEEREICEFILCGNSNLDEKETKDILIDAANEISQIHLIDVMPREELLKLYDEIDVVVVTSLEETTSAVAVEGLMYGKIVICSDSCGICNYLADGKNGFVFESRNEESLLQKIQYVINNYDKLFEIKKSGRATYESVYSDRAMRNAIDDLFTYDYSININMKECSGCGACALKCPVSAIVMKENEKGFLYPEIDQQKCIRCGDCKSVCPINCVKVYEQNEQINKDSDLQIENQSGSVFKEMAENVLNRNGVVYGVGLNDKFQAVYMRVDSIVNLDRLIDAKYVQAMLLDAFMEIKNDLNAGKIVLFNGTSCYVAGLLNYLKDCDITNLITCDMVCRGVSSPKLFKEYVSYMQSGNRDDKQTDTYNVNDGLIFTDDYEKLIHSNCYLRDCCYMCTYSDHRNQFIPAVRPYNTDEVWDVFFNKGIKALLRRYAVEFDESFAQVTTLEKWGDNMHNGIYAADYLMSHGVRRIALYGELSINNILIKEFNSRGLYDVEIITEECVSFDKYEKILITNETDFSDILVHLSKSGFDLKNVIPLSFAVYLEV